MQLLLVAACQQHVLRIAEFRQRSLQCERVAEQELGASAKQIRRNWTSRPEQIVRLLRVLLRCRGMREEPCPPALARADIDFAAYARRARYFLLMHRLVYSIPYACSRYIDSRSCRRSAASGT